MSDGSAFFSSSSNCLTSPVVIENCVWNQSYAPKNGGAIYIECMLDVPSGHITLTRNAFYKCTSGGSGGGVYIRYIESSVQSYSSYSSYSSSSSSSSSVFSYSSLYSPFWTPIPQFVNGDAYIDTLCASLTNNTFVNCSSDISEGTFLSISFTPSDSSLPRVCLDHNIFSFGSSTTSTVYSQTNHPSTAHNDDMCVWSGGALFFDHIDAQLTDVTFNVTTEGGIVCKSSRVNISEGKFSDTASVDNAYSSVHHNVVCEGWMDTMVKRLSRMYRCGYMNTRVK